MPAGALPDCFWEYVPMPARDQVSRYSEQSHDRGRPTLVVMELLRTFSIEHLVQLHNIRIRSVPREFIPGPVKTQHEASLVRDVGGIVVISLCHDRESTNTDSQILKLDEDGTTKEFNHEADEKRLQSRKESGSRGTGKAIYEYLYLHLS